MVTQNSYIGVFLVIFHGFVLYTYLSKLTSARNSSSYAFKTVTRSWNKQSRLLPVLCVLGAAQWKMMAPEDMS